MPPFPVMMVLDADGNGEISADEINNATAALKKLDRNRNGKLDADELRPSFGGGPPGGGFGGGPPGGGREGGGHGGFGGQSFVGGMLERYDEDKDGKLAAVKVFNVQDGISWHMNGGRQRTETDLSEWTGKRASAGKSPPTGFPRPPRFT